MAYSTVKMNRKLTGKLQVILLSAERNCKGKICERKCVKEVFFRKLASRHLATSL